jgi:hypothetical protein
MEAYPSNPTPIFKGGHEEHEVYNHGYSNSSKKNYRPSSFNASSARELSTTISAVMFCGI